MGRITRLAINALGTLVIIGMLSILPASDRVIMPSQGETKETTIVLEKDNGLMLTKAATNNIMWIRFTTSDPWDGYRLIVSFPYGPKFNSTYVDNGLQYDNGLIRIKWGENHIIVHFRDPWKLD